MAARNTEIDTDDNVREASERAGEELSDVHRDTIVPSEPPHEPLELFIAYRWWVCIPVASQSEAVDLFELLS